MRAEDANGSCLVVADLNTGGVLVGDNDADLPTKPGVRVVGHTVEGSHQDSKMW